MLHKFRRGLEVLNQGLLIHELFDLNDNDEEEDEGQILLSSVKSQIEQQKIFKDIGLLDILDDVEENNNNLTHLDDKIVDFVN